MTEKIITSLNTLYLVKVLVERLDDISPAVVEVSLKGFNKINNNQTDLDMLFDMPASKSAVLDERKDFHEWYEQSIFINTKEFTDEITIKVHAENCRLYVRYLPIIIKASEAKVVREAFEQMSLLKAERVGRKYSLFLNTEEALHYQRDVIQTIKSSNQPIVRLRATDICFNPNSYLIGFIGDQLCFTLLETYYTVVRLEPETLDIMSKDMFDLILIQSDATQLLPFGQKQTDEHSFVEQCIEIFSKIETPILELVTNESHNSIYSTLRSLRNCNSFQRLTVAEFELCHFTPDNSHERSLGSIAIPNASDLYQFSNYMSVVSQLIEYGFFLSIFEANYGHVPLRTSERFNSSNVKVYQTLTAREIALIAKQSGFVLLSGQTLRTRKDLMTLCAIALSNGAIPILFGDCIDDDLKRIALSVNSFSALYREVTSLLTQLLHEKKWLSLYRNLKRLKTDTFVNVIDNVVQGKTINEKSFKKSSAEMICVTKRVDMLDNILNNFQRQSYANLSLHIIWNVDETERHHCEKFIQEYQSKDIRISILDQSYNIGNCLNHGIRSTFSDFWFKIDDDDYYGTHYIEDLVNWYEATDADVVGKPSAYMHFLQTNTTILRSHAQRQVRKELVSGKYFCGATLSGRTKSNLPLFSNYYRNSCDSKWIEELHKGKYKIFIGDSFNFIINRGDLSRHTWQIEEKALKDSSTELELKNLKGWIDAT